MRVGFIGLGDQGGPMARRIVEHGYPTTLWARRPESLAPFADTAAEYAGSPRELGAACELVCICVVDEAGVRQLLLGDDGVLAGMAQSGTDGKVVAVQSTISPQACREFADAAARLGIEYADAPVSGGGAAAAAGNLLVLVGASDTVQTKIRPVFETFGDPVLHVGAVGKAQQVKLINNAMMAANTAVAWHALELADALGVERAAVAAATHHGSGQSRAMDYLERFDHRRENFPDHAVALLHKDIKLMIGLDRTDDGGAAEALAAAADGLIDRAAPAVSG